MVTTFFAYEGLNATNLFYLLFALSFAMAVYMTRKYLLMFTWFICELALSVRYNLNFIDSNNVPHSGPVLLLSNHISWIDWLIVQFPLERRMTFMMDREIYNWPVVHRFFKWGRAIPLSVKAAKDAFRTAKERIGEQELVTLFPEGSISRSLELQPFQRGFEFVAKGSNGAIVPCYIGGMWGSRLSRAPKRFVEKRALLRRKVTVIYGEPMPMDSTAQAVHDAVQKLKECYDAQ
jgi:acyl-[acyl-carrier-protein]-phospholipid O-acyltransferase/long-chain-fatty-acid--[acyl-carrier-protein] ligase